MSDCVFPLPGGLGPLHLPVAPFPLCQGAPSLSGPMVGSQLGGVGHGGRPQSMAGTESECRHRVGSGACCRREGGTQVLEEGRIMVLLWEPGAVGAQPSHFIEAPLHGPAKALSPPGALVSSF